MNNNYVFCCGYGDGILAAAMLVKIGFCPAENVLIEKDGNIASVIPESVSKLVVIMDCDFVVKNALLWAVDNEERICLWLQNYCEGIYESLKFLNGKAFFEKDSPSISHLVNRYFLESHDFPGIWIEAANFMSAPLTGKTLPDEVMSIVQDCWSLAPDDKVKYIRKITK